jgi:dTDP-4-dehydrorhamnose 3,5-epimerase
MKGGMNFIRTDILDVVLIEPAVFEDARGGFFETYRRDEFKAHGIADEFVQDNHSVSKRGVLRGLHFQIPPHTQAKLVRVVRGEAFDVVVDLRRHSPSYGRHVTTVLSAANRRMLYVPPGFAHGFLALADDTEFLYKVSAFHSPSDERGLAWDDPDLGIAWPVSAAPYALSEKDRRYPRLKDLQPLF